MSAPIISLEELAPALPAAGALMGLDLGTKTIGLAVSDLGRRIASPLAVIARKKFSIDVEALVRHMAIQHPAPSPKRMRGCGRCRLRSRDG